MFQKQIASNKKRTIGVVLLYFIVFLLIGAALGYFMLNDFLAGMIISASVGAIYTLLMVSNASKVVMRMNNAREITAPEQFPMYYNIVSDLALVSRLPMPKMYIIEDPSPNAFAAGTKPENAAVAVTTGLLERLNREELEGVLAHEFGHIYNYDVRLQTIAVALGAAVSLLTQLAFRSRFYMGRGRRNNDNNSDGSAIIMMIGSVLLLILGPMVTTILQMALSRNREYLADATAVKFTRNPQGLITALEKISQSAPMRHVSNESRALYIFDPLKKSNAEKDSWFSTHPATVNRINRLKQMGNLTN
ncbi:zinc metalloprotease HtpX [Atopobacter phocae]|uniref:zinc metalloprotease HtpX n=1 Tax=Atopobacter phocae TaxID=136492 RepID=UPI0004711064|nr:zinc metalloprotease HtpX [Atopobacter phocae]